jgi:diguanylate cyclase (GGDEF)-like protein/PAS domain S-box-containing protein
MDRIDVLLLEDNDTDAELLERSLRAAELPVELHRARNRPEFLGALANVQPALIICDYTLPGFDGISALDVAREQHPDCPFIFVSGTIGEERAIDALKKGAADYVLKDNMRRLVPAVQRALKEAKDARARRQIEKTLRETKERYESLVERSPEGILLVSKGIITFANHAAMVLYRAGRPEQLVGRPYAELIHEESLGLVTTRLRPEHEANGFQSEIEQKHLRLDGSAVYVEIISAETSLHGQDVKLIFTRDITDRKRSEAELAHQATHDALTGLANRSLINERLQHAVATAKRHKWNVALAFFDVDEFKSVNDSFGHDAGDRVLKDIANRLASSMRITDTIARLGGDEFLVLLPGIEEPEFVTQLISRALAEIAKPILVNGQEIVLTCSAGISIYPLDAPDADLLLRNADTAMYRAKQKGRNAFEYFTPDMSANSMEQLLMSASLRRAVEREEFRIHYQPQVDARSGKLSGVEALIRWEHPDRGLILPGQFVPLCETTGLIVPISQWILRTACGQMQRLQDELSLPFVVSVNLSARQFRQTDLVAFIKDVLAQSGFPPQILELELTESVVAQDVAFAVETMENLKSLGLRIAIDDFGTGYSSLSYLKHFPVDRLKIDMSFVSGITSDPADAAICRTIISLARNLGLNAIAEGVETREQLVFLQEHGCDDVQGYLVARPMPEEQLRAYISSL